MISHWLTPDEKSSIQPARLSKVSLWHQLSFLHEDDFQFSSSDLLIIGFERKASQRIKKHLYQFHNTPSSSLRIVDCGNFHQQDPDVILPVLKEITEGGAMIMLLAPPMSFMRHQVAGVRMATIIRESNLDDDIHLRMSHPGPVFQYIGTQRHLISETHQSIEGHLRLSDLREELNLAEPCIRDSDTMVFHCDSLSAAEAGYMTGMSSSGLSVIEACQLFRYAGATQALSTVGIYGYSYEGDSAGITANSLAQMIWYFLEGSTMREDPEKSVLTQYVVQAKDNEHTFLFYKSEISGRWWIENKEGRKTPCSYYDYRQACEDDYSQRIMRSMLG